MIFLSTTVVGILTNFYKRAGEVSCSSLSTEGKEIALRVFGKTYFIKDEVWCSHQMISPLKESQDQQSWKNLGKSFSITRINRPHFDVFGKEIEFDFSPKRWMLTLMRHFRLLRALTANVAFPREKDCEGYSSKASLWNR